MFYNKKNYSFDKNNSDCRLNYTRVPVYQLNWNDAVILCREERKVSSINLGTEALDFLL